MAESHVGALGTKGSGWIHFLDPQEDCQSSCLWKFIASYLWQIR